MLQFIAGLRNWQNFSYDDKMKFTYKIYDLDGSGFIEPSELVRSTHAYLKCIRCHVFNPGSPSILLHLVLTRSVFAGNMFG